MEQSSTATLWILLLTGLVLTAVSIFFLFKQEKRIAFFQSVNPSIKPRLSGRLSIGLLSVGVSFLLVYFFEVIPFPHSRPYWIVALSLVLSPLSLLGLTVIFLVSVFKRSK